jgi:predicted GNAT family acetyltransferase
MANHRAERKKDQLDDAAAVDRNFVATFRALSDGVEGALVRTIGRVPVAATMLPLAFFNAAFVAEPLPDGARDLEDAVTLLRELGVPFTVHLRSDLEPATRTAADGLGLAWTGTLPGMAMRPRPAPDAPAGLTIRRATTAAELADHRAVAAAAFGMSPDLVARLMPSALLGNPAVRVYVGLEDGLPVASSLAFRTGEIVGIYNVATLDVCRGRGYGTAMTWAAIADAAPDVEVAILQASAPGRPVYERMGFRTVVEYEELEDAAGEPDRGHSS